MAFLVMVCAFVCVCACAWFNQSKQGDIVTQIPAAGRNRRIVIGPRPPPELDGSPRTKAGSGRPAVISDFVEIVIERTFVAKLCSVAEDLAPVGSMELRLLQYVDATGNAFTTRYAQRTRIYACLHCAAPHHQTARFTQTRRR